MYAREQGVVGRDHELAALDTMLDDARAGTEILAVEGAPGIGKTTIWRAAVDRARNTGFTVLTTRATEAEAGLALLGLADLFGDVGDDALVGLPSPQADAFAGALLRAATPSGVDERALFASVLGVVRALSAAGPVLVAVDDAQWLDIPSARALAFALRRLEHEPVGFLVTVRNDIAPVQTFERADPARRRRVSLGPLTVAALHEIIRRETGTSLARPTAVRVTGASGGNPLHAIEIVAEMQRVGYHGHDVPVPPSLGALLEERVSRLPARTQDALLVTAALSRPTTEFVDAKALEPAERARLVEVERGGIRFVHPMFASAVYRSADPVARRRVHLALSEAVREPEEQARHLALASTVPDEAIATRLDEAAVIVAARGAPDSAAELVDLAIDSTLSTDDQTIAQRRVNGARYRFDSGDLGTAESMLRRTLDENGDGPWRAQALRLLSQLHGRRSNFDDALATARDALAHVHDDETLRTEIDLDVAFFYTSLGDFVAGQEHARRAVAGAEAMGGGPLAEALAVFTICEFLGGRGLDETRLARALQLEDPSRPTAFMMRPRYIQGSLLLWTARCDESIAVLDALHDDLLERGEDAAIPFLTPSRAWAALWRGDVRDAARVVAEARDDVGLADDAAAQAVVWGFDALVLAFTGPLERVQTQAQRSLELFGGLQWMSGTIWPMWALGLAALVSGDAAMVDDLLGPLAQVLTAMESIDPVLAVFLPDEIEALVELGRLDEAEAFSAWLTARAASVGSAWGRAAACRCEGLVAGARGEHSAGVAILEGAADQFAALAMPIERARTLVALGRLHRRSKQKRLARLALEEALQLFDAAGAQLWSARAAAELARVATRRAASGLTATEERIAQLAANGLTNREIAERVFVSPKTVEANLGRAYRKLGISSRAQLGRALDLEGRA